MDVEITALLLYYYQRRKKMKRKKKKIWVHPFVSNRSQSGVFLKLYEDLRKYPEKMLNYLRMSLTAMLELEDSIPGSRKPGSRNPDHILVPKISGLNPMNPGIFGT
ncbi:hypothetical protein ACJJTC_018545 [Scirpophaga incertulas]